MAGREKIRLAIIGSYGHVSVALSDPEAAGVEVVAAAKWGPDDPMRFIGKFPSAPDNLAVYEDYREMLSKVRPEIVGVFMPLYRNAEASIAAAELGCHILSEKPLATELADLTSLREAAADAEVRIAACHTARCEGRFQTIRNTVESGKIGTPLLASAQKSYPFAQRDDFCKDRRTYGGSIPWQAIHAIDFVTYCTGKDYRRVAAMNSNCAHPSHTGMEDAGGIVFELNGGGHAVISFDYLRPWGKADRSWGDERLRIAGTDGVIELSTDGSEVVLTTPDKTENIPLDKGRDLLGEFAASIRGDRECVVTTEESLRITEVALKARQAAETGKFIDL